MKKSQLAVQIYSFRDYIKTPKEAIETLKKLKVMGYDNIQVSPSMPEMPEKELRSMLDDIGLFPCSSSKRGVNPIDNPEEVIEHLKLLGCMRTVYNPAVLSEETEKDIIELAHKLEKAAVDLKKEGLTLALHNHAFEFNRFGNRTMLDILFEETEVLEAEIDTYWVHKGGGNPVSWVQRMSGRMGQIHLKDYAMTCKESHDAPVGEGNLDWNSIINAAEQGGVNYFVVEHDGTCPDPFASFKSSIDYLMRNFVK